MRVDSLLPQIYITKHTLKKIEAVHLVREHRSGGRQELRSVHCYLAAIQMGMIDYPKDRLHLLRFVRARVWQGVPTVHGIAILGVDEFLADGPSRLGNSLNSRAQQLHYPHCQGMHDAR